VRTAHGAEGAAEIEVLYASVRQMLLYVACGKFRVPVEDAEAIAQDAIVGLLTTASRVENRRAWLVGATCNASRAYWRNRARFDAHHERQTAQYASTRPDIDLPRVELEMTLRDLLLRLPSRDREVLRLHYYEHVTAAGVAQRLGTTVGYAEKLIVQALKRLRILYHATTPPK
jgi:RNA polymerase sigma factor (sigma-70 family)